MEMWREGMYVMNKHKETPMVLFWESWCTGNAQTQKIVMDYVEREEPQCLRFVNPKTNKTALMSAAANGKTIAVDCLLRCAEIDAQDEDGSTALVWAALWDHPEVIHLLLQAGANTKLVTKFLGYTAQQIAMAMGCEQAADCLDEYNRNMRATTKRTRTS
jgi:ankyrin repeat protein